MRFPGHFRRVSLALRLDGGNRQFPWSSLMETNEAGPRNQRLQIRECDQANL